MEVAAGHRNSQNPGTRTGSLYGATVVAAKYALLKLGGYAPVGRHGQGSLKQRAAVNGPLIGKGEHRSRSKAADLLVGLP